MVKNLKWMALIILLLPITINMICSIPTIITINNNDWIGFWGSYLGSIIGGTITLYVLYQTNKVTKEIQDKNMGFDFKKEVFFKAFENTCEMKQTIDNCNIIESIDINRLNYLININGLNIIDEQFVSDYNQSLSKVLQELKYFVIEQYLKCTDKDLNENGELDNRYMDFQFSDEENKVALEISRYILGAKDLEVFERFEPIRNYIRRRAYSYCSDGMEFWIIDVLIGFINSKDELQTPPIIDNCIEIKEMYLTYKKDKEILLKDINRVIEDNKSTLNKDK